MKTKKQHKLLWNTAGILMTLILLSSFIVIASAATPVYVRPDGDDVNCDGTANVAYPGSGSGLACAFKTIQKGIDSVDVGGTVRIYEGTYLQNPNIINKAMTVEGTDRDAVIIGPQAADTGDGHDATNGTPQTAFFINASNVTIKNLTIDGQANPGLSGNNFRHGIYHYQSPSPNLTGILIQDVNVYHTLRRGISIGQTNNSVTVTGCVVEDVTYMHAIRVDTAKATVTNNTVRGAAQGISIGPGSSNPDPTATTTITGNVLEGIGHVFDAAVYGNVAIYYRNPNDDRKVIVQDNEITAAAVANTIVGMYLYNLNTDSEVSGNSLDLSAPSYTTETLFWGYSYGIYLGGTAGVTVDNNTITMSRQGTGIYLGRGSNGTPDPNIVSRNTITTSNPISGALGESCGISSSSDPTFDIIGEEQFNSDALISNNLIDGFDRGILLYQGPTYNVSATIAGNSIINSVSYAIDASSLTRTTANASGNWWDSNAPATVKAYTHDGSGVDYTPWLDSGTDTSADPGFQGDFHTLWVDDDSPQTGASGRIQEGIDLVAGSTVNVAAGSYVENVVINKSLTLAGAGQANTTIYPALSAPNPCADSTLCGGAASTILLVQADNVIIHDLTADGDNPGLTSGVVRGGADLDARNGIVADNDAGVFTGLEVYNLTVKNIYLRGINATTGGTFNLHHNTVTNVQGDYYSIAMFAWYGPGTMAYNDVSYANDAIAANHSKGIQFLNNTISHSGSSIHTDNAGDTSGSVADLIQGNQISDCTAGGYGVWVFVPYIAPTFNNNTVTNCDVGFSAWGQGAAVTTLFTNNVLVGPSGGTGSVGVYITTDIISWGYRDVSVLLTDNIITDFETGVYYTADPQTWNPDPWTSQTINATFTDNAIFGNTYGADKGTQGVYNLNMEYNWWGDLTGPLDPLGTTEVPPCSASHTTDLNADGTGDSVGEGIDYCPWTDYVQDELLQEVIDNSCGGTVLLGPQTYTGGLIVSCGVTIRGTTGTVVTHGSPAFTITGDGVTIEYLEIDMGGDTSPAIVTGNAVNDLVLKNLEIHSGGAGSDGIQIAHNVSNLQIYDNYIHNMGGDGLEYASGTAVTGVHEVQGNLFQVNTGCGVNNASGIAYDVTYNSWGDILGPALGVGDGVSGSLTYDPWTHAALSMVYSGSPVPDKVGVGSQISYNIQIDAARLYGADFDLAFDNTLLSVVSITNSGLLTQASPGCALSTPAEANASGVISFCGNSYSEVNGAAQSVYTVVFQGVAAGVSPLAFDATDDQFAMAPP
ncbi:MAG: right-handed parallel beta-helix repeat-containing protein, partial [Anaerolineales bacterium]|nr:right-handed parallel beta-helix repeat-containing protein [Anaerolineales bacterium]